MLTNELEEMKTAVINRVIRDLGTCATRWGSDLRPPFDLHCRFGRPAYLRRQRGD